LFWQWIFAPVVIALQPIVSPQLFNSTMLTLPIRTAASIPFGLLALLAVLMGRVMRKSTEGRTAHGLAMAQCHPGAHPHPGQLAQPNRNLFLHRPEKGAYSQ
jgi:hypothetical protein